MIVFTCFLYLSCGHVEKNYYANGKIESEIPYKNKKINGIAVWYYSHGQRSLEITCKDGVKDGTMTRFYRNGQKETVEHYKNDTLHGTSLKFNEKGGLMLESGYKNGKKDGVIKQYYSDGSLFMTGNYIDDQYDGTWEYFDEEGFKVGEGAFDQGEGILTGYDDMGNITRRVYYKNSIMFKEEIYSRNSQQIEKIISYKDNRIADIQIIDNQTAKK
ncbi:MAG: toxin-antitoxin system YwqK family antitoxin [Bacteroidales bacterium]|jgi:antitoxin component YwqK of YwqJK toxin-antitoxin module|nr:toxin-antitoxin system YwqK family antitoxin [Bacteroidales bacterium]